SRLLPPHAFPTRRSSDLLSPRLQGHLLLSREGFFPLPEFRAGRRADAEAIPGLRRHQAALSDEALHQLPHIAICQVVFSILVARSEEHTSELQSRFDLVC